MPTVWRLRFVPQVLALFVFAVFTASAGCDNEDGSSIFRDWEDIGSTEYPITYSGFIKNSYSVRSFTGASVSCDSSDRIDITLHSDGSLSGNRKYSVTTAGEAGSGKAWCKNIDQSASITGTHSKGDFKISRNCSDAPSFISGTYGDSGIQGSGTCEFSRTWGGGTWNYRFTESFEIPR